MSVLSSTSGVNGFFPGSASIESLRCRILPDKPASVETRLVDRVGLVARARSVIPFSARGILAPAPRPADATRSDRNRIARSMSMPAARSSSLLVTGLLRLVPTLFAACVLSACGAQGVPGHVLDEAARAKRTAESFPAADEDYFHDMDGGLA